MTIYVWRDLITTPGIYHNPTLGLISLSSDGINRTTIADKNLGATQVYNDGDTLSEANCGKYFQWGNNYGFPRTGSITNTSATQVDASTYGPGNYYNSSTWITALGWDSSNNFNLRGSATGTSEAEQGPCANGYHIPHRGEYNKLTGILNGFGLSSNDVTKYLKYPLGGIRLNSTNISSQGTRGSSWICEKNNATTAYFFYVNNSTYTTAAENISNGHTIRPFKNEPVQPRTGEYRTVLYQVQLLSYEEIKAMNDAGGATQEAGVTELNKYPERYYNKFNSEGKM